MKIKKPEFEGSFYPNYSDKLDRILEYFIYNGDSEDYKTRAIIVPHAGYVYSGETAGLPYQILGKNKKLKTIVIFAPSHNFDFDGITYSDFDIFETLLGRIEVDKKLLDKIKNEENLIEENEPFSEHSLEVQLPFIQKTFEERKIKILPFIVGNVELKTLANLIEKLWQDESLGFVFSTDLSHFLSKDECKKTDDKTIKLIEKLDYQGLKHDMLCGYNPICGLLQFAKDKNLKVINISRSDSSKQSKDEKQVVGYGGFIIT